MKFLKLGQCLNLFSTPRRSSEKRYKPHLTTKEFEQIAVVTEKICSSQRGRVRYQGSYWYAMVEQDFCFLPEMQVLVIRRESLTLVVQPIPPLKESVAANPDKEQFPPLKVIRKQSMAKKRIA